MTGINKVILVGNVGMIECKATASGLEYINLSVATSKTYKKDGEKIDKTQWHNVTFFNACVPILKQHTKKGDKIYIEGELQTQKYIDKSGVERYATKIIGNNMQNLTKKSDASEHKEEEDDAFASDYEATKKLYEGVK